MKTALTATPRNVNERPFRYHVAVIMLTSTLAACATGPHPPKVETHDVNLTVAVSCVPASVGPKPTYDDTEQAWKAVPGATPAERNAERVKLLQIGRAQRDKRLAVLEPVVAGCR